MGFCWIPLFVTSHIINLKLANVSLKYGFNLIYQTYETFYKICGRAPLEEADTIQGKQATQDLSACVYSSVI